MEKVIDEKEDGEKIEELSRKSKMNM